MNSQPRSEERSVPSGSPETYTELQCEGALQATDVATQELLEASPFGLDILGGS